MDTNILQNIFKDNWETIKTGNYRPTVIENVEKMIHCGDPSYGGTMYKCPVCGNTKFEPFRCHSRFCPTCGNMYNMRRCRSMMFKLVDTPHRHCVFTIDKEIRIFFFRDRSLLSCLFDAVRTVILTCFRESAAKHFELTPGMIMVLQTYGRSLQWNPHIHTLITEGGVCANGAWRKKTYFNYTYLRKSFQTVLLKLMEKHMKKTSSKDLEVFRKVKNQCYKNHVNGFYVYAKARKNSSTAVLSYIGRYLGRPAIATSRIDEYKENFVTFHYNRHEDGKYVEEKLPVTEFINRLVQHIPEKHFKTIRYAGIYARHRKNDRFLRRRISLQVRKIYDYLNKWPTTALITFKYNPLECSCGAYMRVVYLIINGHKVSPAVIYLHHIMRRQARDGPPSVT